VGFGGVRQSVCMVIVEQFSRSAKYKDDKTLGLLNSLWCFWLFLDALLQILREVWSEM
jgi:hypothetical protein